MKRDRLRKLDLYGGPAGKVDTEVGIAESNLYNGKDSKQRQNTRKSKSVLPFGHKIYICISYKLYHMLSPCVSFLEYMMSKTVLVPMSAVNKLIATPRLRVTAKPFIGPVPNWNNTAAVISVVTCESKIVQNALWYPPSTADLGFFPLLSSSLILSNMRTLESTAIPTASIIPAIPGMVSVELIEAIAPSRSNILSASAKSAITPDTL